MSSPNTLPAASAKSEKALAAIERYGDRESLLVTFNPSKQVEYTADIERAYTGAAPSLATVAEAYGKGTARSWLMIQLDNLAEFSGSRQKMPIAKTEEVAFLIIAEYGYLRLTELMHFFRRFKLGAYGRFYGAIDPMIITDALREFMKERSVTLARLERERAERLKYREPDYILYRRRLEAQRRKGRFYSYNFRASDFTFEEFCELWWLFNLGYERDDHGYIEN